MQTINEQMKMRIRQGWLMIGLGLILLVVGIALPRLFPGVTWSFKWVEGFGLVMLALGGMRLVRYLHASREPVAALRKFNEENDERILAINYQAGNAAFIFMIVVVGIALILYSAMTRGQPYDALWLFMAASIILPTLFYIAALLYLNNQK